MGDSIDIGVLWFDKGRFFSYLPRSRAKYPDLLDTFYCLRDKDNLLILTNRNHN